MSQSRHVLLTTLPSDAHTWNLVFLQRLVEEHGHRVTNLGACVPTDVLLAACRRCEPDLVVVSSVNGHGHHDGRRVITRLRREPRLADTPVVIGGKLDLRGGTSGVVEDLLRAGYDAVYDDAAGLPAFRALLASLGARRAA